MRRFLCGCFLLFSVGCVFAGNTPISLDSIVAGAYKPALLPAARPLSDARYYTVLSTDGKKLNRYDYKTGTLQETLIDVETARGESLKKMVGYCFNPQENRILIWSEERPLFRRSWQTEYYLYDRKRNLIEPLSDRKNQRDARFSPDGRSVSFSSENNLYIRRLDFGSELTVTTDGLSNALINGTTDWVYEEEFGLTAAYDWSSDSQYLAYLKFDERGVSDFTLTQYGLKRPDSTDPDYYPSFKLFKYPSSGGINAKVTLHVYHLQSRSNKTVTIPVPEDGYYPRIRFTRKANQLAVMTLDRDQTSFKLYFLNVRSGISNLVISEQNEAYVEPDFDAIRFYSSYFTYLSERNGFRHLYLYDANGSLLKQLTTGNWDVTEYLGCDTLKQRFYFQAAVSSPLERSIWQVDAKGKNVKVSTKAGVNSAAFNSDYTVCMLTTSSINTPPETRAIDLTAKEGKNELRIVVDNEGLKRKLDALSISQKSFITVPSADGVQLNGWMLKPTDFDASKRYPAILLQYSGPDSQEVRDEFKLNWEHYLASKGFVVVCVDGRGTGARGAAFRRLLHKQLGLLEAKDQIAVADYLKQQSFIDGNRLGIWGWSYGGFVTLMVMTETNQPFKAGIAVAPVTDFRYYNTIYSERYLKTPGQNREGYDMSSPLRRVSNLTGRLLLIHGLMDDNVRPNQSMDLVEALIKAGKQFDTQWYPTSSHSILGETYRRHLYRAKVDFFIEQLQ